MKRVDMETWERRELFDFFGTVSNPFYMVTIRTDVTAVYRYAKENNFSFYYAMVWLCGRAVNRVRNFRYAIRDGAVVETEERIPSFCDMHRDSELFHIVNHPCGDDIRAFCRSVAEKSREQRFFIDYGEETAQDMIYISCIPWVTLVSATNELDVLNPANRDDNTPRILWGRYEEQGERKLLNLSLEVNHRFIDGIHIGKFSAALEEEIAALQFNG